MMVQIIPSVLATTEEQYQTDITKLASSQSLAEGWVHIDFADNQFVPNQTIGVETVQKLPINFRKEAHLMVETPLSWIDQLVQAGFEKVIIHLESKDTEDCIKKIKEDKMDVGIALKIETPIEKLEPLIDKISTVLIMTIEAGFQGQPFIPHSLNKVRSIKSKNWPVRVGVDGAVKDTDVKQIVESGVDFMIVGSFLLEGDIDNRLERLWEEIRG